MAIVLALDIATASGAAWDGPTGAPQFTTFRLPSNYGPDDIGPRVRAFVNWMHGLAGLVKPSIIAVEAPLVVHSDSLKTNVDTVRLLITLAGIAHYVADCLSPRPRVIEKNVMSVKKHLTGSGRADKAAVMAACRRLGWQIKSDHEADACALWALVKAENDPGFSYRTTPLSASADDLTRRQDAARAS